MNVRNANDIPEIDMGDKLPGVTMQVLLGPDQGAGNFVMRRFSLKPDAATPHHDHEWEHEAFVLEGRGVLVFEDKEIPLKAWDVALVPAGTVHQFRNTGSERFSFMCIVPMKGHG